MSGTSPPAVIRGLIKVLLLLFPEDAQGVTRIAMEDTLLDRWRAEEVRAGFLSTGFVIQELWSLLAEGIHVRAEVVAGFNPFVGLVGDLRFVVRALLKSPAFTVGAIVMLALGIGVNAATFSLIKGEASVADRFEDSDELFFVWRVQPGRDEGRWSIPGFLELREQATAFEELEVYQTAVRYLTGAGEPMRTTEIQTSPNLPSLLGLNAAVGRLYGPGDLAPSAPDVAVLTHRLWVERYGGDAGVVGRTIRLNEVPYSIIGVLPEKVEFEMLWRGAGVFTPLPLDVAQPDWNTRTLAVMARLADGASAEMASAQAEAVSARLAEAHPESHADVGVRIEGFGEYFFFQSCRRG